jgi:hypothetical protein
MDEENEGAIAEWTLRGIKAAKFQKPRHDPMGGEDGIHYIHPPTPLVHHLMVEFGFTRHMAERVACIA